MVKRAAAPKTNYIAMPSVGIGYYKYWSPSCNFGTPETVKTLTDLAILWAAFPVSNGPSYNFGLGDMSHVDGHRMRGHASHTNGKCADIRPVRKDRAQSPCQYTWETDYDQEETQRLIYLFSNHPNVDYIYYNDPTILGVSPQPNHQHHFHVVFKT